MTSVPTAERQSGMTQAEEVSREIADEADKPLDLPNPDQILWRTPGFHRMRTSMSDDERSVMDAIHHQVEGEVITAFADAYRIMEEVYEVVRQAEVDGAGNPRRDAHGLVIWQRDHLGGYVEDWSKLNHRERERFLFSITTKVFAWSQKAARMWGEAMFTKTMWEERFSMDYSTPRDGTIDDRTAAGRTGAIDERYLAVYAAYVSRRADAVVRSMELLATRLKDVMLA